MGDLERSRSYVMRILRLLHERGPMAAQDLFSALQVSYPPYLPPRGVDPPRIETILEELAEIGCIEVNGGTYTLSPHSTGRDGGGHSGGGDGLSDDGRDGITEVLEHPILFCVDDDSFEEALSRSVILVETGR